MGHGISEVDPAFVGIIGDALEEFQVEVILVVVKDELFMQGNRVVELVLEIQIARLREHLLQNNQNYYISTFKIKTTS